MTQRDTNDTRKPPCAQTPDERRTSFILAWLDRAKEIEEAARKVIADVDSSVQTADLPATHTLKMNVEQLRKALNDE